MRRFTGVAAACAAVLGVIAGPALAGSTPDTQITSGPSGTVASWTATFTFRSSKSGSTYQCTLDGSAWTSCVSPKTYSPLKNGTHSFSVRALANGRVDGSPATRQWTVAVPPPPAPTISSAPSGTVASSSASIAFADAQSGVTFACSLDGAADAACSSPASYAGLADGSHSFSVTAIDAAGNSSAAATAAWRVDTTPPPAPTIASGPAATTTDTTAAFSFSDTEAGATFACALDSGAPAACTSPTSYSGLAVGTHTFAVTARDAAGNGSPAATFTWTVQQPAPPPTTTTTNYLTNGSFESGVTGWTSWQGAVTAASDGVVGSGAAKVSLTAAATTYTIYPSTRPITSTTPGVALVASGWVRSDNPGRRACLDVREFDSTGAIAKQVESCVTAATTWQKLPAISYTTTTSGGQLTVFVQDYNATAGSSIEVDDLQLTDATATTSSDPIVVAAGDAACSSSDPDFNGGAGTGTRCMQGATTSLIGSIANKTAFLPLGDLQYECGTLSEFNAVYAVTWGKFDAISYPVPGNHEYGDFASGCTQSQAEGYYAYFGSRAGDPAKGYYSFDIGAWHVIALNSDCRAVGGCAAGSPQEQWLKADLAAHTNACTLAYWHIPRWSNGQMGNEFGMNAFWTDLVSARADLVLTGHDHTYQRFLPRAANGAVDTANGVTELVVGTGGEELMSSMTPSPELATYSTTTFGVVQLQLHPTGWDGKFLPIAGQTYTDSFSGTCH